MIGVARTDRPRPIQQAMAASDPFEVHVNGERQSVPGAMTVGELLAHLGIDPRQVGVERNREIVQKGEYDRMRLAPGDRLEIVTFVGGG
jgi:thiamine biosynthesis protein ThiS